MKTKIKEALKTKYNNLGLSEDAFDRVATFGETIKDEAEIENFVVRAESLLKGYQSAGDKARSEAANAKKQIEGLRKQLEGLQSQHNATQTTQDVGNEGNADTHLDIASIVTEAIKSQLTPLQAKLETLEKEQTKKSVLATAKSAFDSNEYVKKYKDEADDAWERAVEIYEALDREYTADDLSNKAIGYFNKAVSRRGVDTSKPIESTSDERGKGDYSSHRKRMEEVGKLPTTEK